MRTATTALIAALLLLGSSVAQGRPSLGKRLRQGWVVQGLDGQASLKLDIGRSLKGYPLRKVGLRQLFGSAKSRKGSKSWLSPIEKMRLDAKRIGKASSLSQKAKIERICQMVEKKMPQSDPERYLRFSSNKARSGAVKLSQYTKGGVGICRERSFLLATLLAEAGVRKVRVRYGNAASTAGQGLADLGGHAWVEAKLRGKGLLGRLFKGWWVLEPGVEMRPRTQERPVAVEGQYGNFKSRPVHGPLQNLLYVPTPDLRMQPAF